MAVEVASDNFNRADGDIGANWTLSAANDSGNKPDISSNQLKAQTGTNDDNVYYNAASFDIDQYAQATVKAIGADGNFGISIRANAIDEIWVEKNSANSQINTYWYNGGLYTQIASYASGGYSVNDVIRIEAEGNQIRTYQNGVLRTTANDLDYPIYNYTDNVGTLYPGIKMSDDPDDRIDDWSAGNLYANNRVRAYKEGSTVAGSNVNNDTFTIDSQDNSVFYVVVGARDGSTSDIVLSSATLNGDSLTKIRSDTWNSSTYVRTEIWRLVNPDVGSGMAVALTFAGTCDYTRPQFFHIMGNDQTTPVEVSGGTDGASGAGGTSVSQSVTTITDNAILMDSFWCKDNVDPTVGTGMIIYGATSPNVGDDRYRNSIRRVGAAGSYAMAYTWTNTDGYALSVAGLKAYVAPAGSLVKDLLGGMGVIPFAR